MNVKPMGLALCICESVITEAITNRKTLVGMFNHLGSIAFPVMVPKLCVFVSVTGGHGAVNSIVRCVNEDTGEKVFEVPGVLNFKDPNDVAEANFQFHNVPFAKPGLYCIELLFDDALILARQFRIVQLKQRMTL